ncbi:MAG: sodium:sulfate symporter, partial [Desulfobacula sp.]|nr:sodium:sulfate symporter [Desulfobacula sp.]
MKKEKQATGYDKYINWKIFIIPVILLFSVLLMPTPYGMKDVGTEFKVGPKMVVNHITEELFDTNHSDAEQWQLLTAKMMEQNMRLGALQKDRFLKRNIKWCKKYKMEVSQKNFDKAHEYIKTNVDENSFLAAMEKALDVRKQGLKYEDLTGADKKAADKGAWHIKVAIGMGLFGVACFLTECIPLPAVA